MDAREFLKFMEFCKKENITPTVDELKAWWSLKKLEIFYENNKGKKKNEKMDTWI